MVQFAMTREYFRLKAMFTTGAKLTDKEVDLMHTLHRPVQRFVAQENAQK